MQLYFYDFRQSVYTDPLVTLDISHALDEQYGSESRLGTDITSFDALALCSLLAVRINPTLAERLL
jgi:hypothetical protein